MKVARLTIGALILALPLVASELETIMLPIQPSVVLCGYHSQFETTLLVYNDDVRLSESFGLAPKTGAILSGEIDLVPLPKLLRLPAPEAARMQMSLLVESIDRDRPEVRSYSEIPVVRERDWKSEPIQIAGVRIDEGFRQTLRIYAADERPVEVAVRVYPLGSSYPLDYQDAWRYLLWSHEPDSPAFNMECNLHDLYESGQQVRVEITPLTEGARIWAFVSVTNNVTQDFYTVLPR
jgi:hypothetical protein